MRYKEIINEIKMGYSRTSGKTKKNFTFGAELEFVIELGKRDEEEIYNEMRTSEKYFRKFILDELRFGILPSKSYQDIIDEYNLEPIIGYVNFREYYEENKVERPEEVEKLYDEIYSDDLDATKIVENEEWDKIISLSLIDPSMLSKIKDEGLENIKSRLEDALDKFKNEKEKLIPTINNILMRIENNYNRPQDYEDEINKNYVYSGMSEKPIKIENLSVGDFVKSFDIYDKFANDSDIIENFEEYIRDNLEDEIDNLQADPYQYTKNLFKDVIDIREVTSDQSIHGTDENSKGVELITNVYNDLDKFLNDLKNAFSLIDDHGYTNHSTGLHINIGTWDSETQIDLLKFMLIIGNDRILIDFDREVNAYAEYTIPRIIKFLRDKDLSQQEYKKSIQIVNNYILSNADKREFINFEKLKNQGYIEIRAMGGEDYQLKFKKVENYIRFITRALDIASDPNMYREDYLKKLYKVAKPNITARESKINKFIDYINSIGAVSRITRKNIRSGEIADLFIRSLEKASSTKLKEMERLMSTDVFYLLKEALNKETVYKDRLENLHEQYVEFGEFDDTPKLKKWISNLIK